MEESEEDSTGKKIPIEKGSLGNAQQVDSTAVRANKHISKAELDAKQAAIGQTRKPYGPIPEEDQDIDKSSNNAINSNVPPTDCEEPSVI